MYRYCSPCMYSNQLCSSHNFHRGVKHTCSGFIIQFWTLSSLLYLLETQWHKFEMELRVTTPQSLSLNQSSLFTPPPFGVLIPSLFIPRTPFTPMNISPQSSLTAVQRSPLLTDISTLLRPYTSTNSRPSVLFQRQGMSLRVFTRFIHL